MQVDGLGLVVGISALCWSGVGLDLFSTLPRLFPTVLRFHYTVSYLGVLVRYRYSQSTELRRRCKLRSVFY
jgi:hypothetical protein